MTVTIPDDFDLQKIAASGQAFRIAQTPQGWRFLAGDKLLYLQPGSGDTYTASCTPEEWQGFWHRYFDLNRNYAAIRAAVPKQDAYLCAAARAGAGIRILRQDAWEMLVTFIISQRKNIPAIQACVETLCTRYGAPLLQPGGNVLYAFPTAQALAAAGEQALRDCALGYRAPYVLAAAQAVAAGALDLAALETLPDARLLEAMQQHGVGIKVANCVAPVCLMAVRSVPPVDVWIQRVIDQHYAGQNPFPSLWQRRNFAAVDVLFRPFRKGTSQIERIIKQYRTTPPCGLSIRSGSCGTASALPKCSIRHPVLSALLAWHPPHLARRIGT